MSRNLEAALVVAIYFVGVIAGAEASRAGSEPKITELTEKVTWLENRVKEKEDIILNHCGVIEE